MAKHYNIYYLFLADKANRPMPETRKKEILENLKKFFKNIKPP